MDNLERNGILKPSEKKLVHSLQFLQDVKTSKKKNLAIELLSKLVSDEIKVRRKKNIAHAYTLSEKLQKTLQNYENRTVDSVTIITELIEISKAIRNARKRGEKLKLSEEELAFYDTLEVKDSTVIILGDEFLTSIAKELVETIRNNKSIDWSLRETGRAKIMANVKRVLNKHGYSIQKKDSTTQIILDQASQMFA